jgi:hypothetical protein
MPDWREIVRRRLADLPLRPADEIAIIEELAQHLEDCYREHRASGLSEGDAAASSLGEIDGMAFVTELRTVLPRT